MKKRHQTLKFFHWKPIYKSRSPSIRTKVEVKVSHSLIAVGAVAARGPLYLGHSGCEAELSLSLALLSFYDLKKSIHLLLDSRPPGDFLLFNRAPLVSSYEMSMDYTNES